MASLIFSLASSRVSPWLWHPGSAGQCTSYPYSVLFMTTVYCMIVIYHKNNLAVKEGYVLFPSIKRGAGVCSPSLASPNNLFGHL